MTVMDYFLDSLIIILPFYAALIISNLPWTNKEIQETHDFWTKNI